MELEGNVAAVTGASQGIGKAIVLKVAGLGPKVGLSYVAIEAGERVDGTAGQVMTIDDGARP
jgi:NAD(P)-dependent dehydrogenase (short-subunit alcohol dehydrogenase family)